MNTTPAPAIVAYYRDANTGEGAHMDVSLDRYYGAYDDYTALVEHAIKTVERSTGRSVIVAGITAPTDEVAPVLARQAADPRSVVR